MPVIHPPSTHRARGADQRRRPRRWPAVSAALAAVVLSVPAAAAAKPSLGAESLPNPVGSSQSRVAAVSAVAAATSLSSGLKIGVYPDDSTWTNNGITSIYAGPNYNGSKFPLAQAKASLAKGVSLDITLHPRGTPYIAGIVSGDATATAWLNAYIANIKTLADYSTSLKNGTYVVAALMHESEAQIREKTVTGASANYTTIGKAQQIAIKRGKAAAPNAYWSVWLVGYDRANEATQLAQITNPKPDIITWDPYENHDCSGTLAGVATADATWVKQQPAYNGNLGLAETGMTTTCSDAQLAKFYTGFGSKLTAIDPAFRFATVFSSDSGKYPHKVTSSKPQALAALKASLRR